MDVNEDQQVRLGLGQVLDYWHQIHQTRRAPQPVLVLERRPMRTRWHELAESLGVILDYGPSFDVVAGLS